MEIDRKVLKSAKFGENFFAATSWSITCCTRFLLWPSYLPKTTVSTQLGHRRQVNMNWRCSGEATLKLHQRQKLPVLHNLRDPIFETHKFRPHCKYLHRDFSNKLSSIYAQIFGPFVLLISITFLSMSCCCCCVKGSENPKPNKQNYTENFNKWTDPQYSGTNNSTWWTCSKSSKSWGYDWINKWNHENTWKSGKETKNNA